MIKIGDERYRCTEPLFQPSLLGMDVGGIQHLAFKSISSCDMDVRQDLFTNLVLSGGSTCFDGMLARTKKSELTSIFTGFQGRLQRELQGMTRMKVGVSAPQERSYSVWAGGSVLASLRTFEERWITRDEYNEFGPNIVHRKCF